jgi:2-polyprenyl-6-methoxyphenol hydroxylase-like FAD-dependent oxidoreductase
MNTGVQDAHNLAWKLCLLLNGVDSPSIMQTYESEHRPVSLFLQAFCSVNVKTPSQSLANYDTCACIL